MNFIKNMHKIRVFFGNLRQLSPLPVGSFENSSGNPPGPRASTPAGVRAELRPPLQPSDPAGYPRDFQNPLRASGIEPKITSKKSESPTHILGW